MNSTETERFQTIVVGGGQAGLTAGYHLTRSGLPFVILDANERVGDVWRKRWDSLRLFTPARFDTLPGMPFPAPADHFPTKDEMGDYLEAYAAHFQLPVRTGVRVERLAREGGRFVVDSGNKRFEAENVVVAMADWQRPRVPEFAGEIGRHVTQLHSSEYKNKSQLRDGPVLVVGAGNSGAEVAMEMARDRTTWLSGNHTGNIPFRVDGPVARILLRPLFRVVFHRILTVKTPIGRKARVKLTSHGMPLIRVKPRDLIAAGVQRVPRTVGAQDGLPLLEDGRVLDVSNVIWCTGYKPGFSWIDLPVLNEGRPVQHGGIVSNEPGLYFVGLSFLYAASSSMIHGVSRDAQRVVRDIAARAAERSVEAPREPRVAVTA